MLGAILSIMVGISALAACAPAQPSGKAPPATPRATATPRLVFQADWSHGLAGWAATSGWSISDGMLHSDTGSDHQITSPFQPATPDYDVEFSIQVITVAKDAAAQIDLSTDAAAGADGYIALLDHVTPVYTMFANHPHVMIYINPMIDQDPSTFQPHDFEMGTHWWTYRVEVRGPEATMLIDGRVVSWARSTKTSRLVAGPLHFDCTGVELRLSDFKVYAM